jgi:hypothetical protein
MDVYNRTTYGRTVEALRSLQPQPKISYDSQDWKRELIEGQQPPAITGMDAGIMSGLPDADETAYEAAHIPLGEVGRVTGAAFYAPRPNENIKEWPAFISGIGRSTLANEHSLYANNGLLKMTYNQAFTGDVFIRDRELLQTPLKQMYTKEELFRVFGAPTICKDGVLAWYAYHGAGKANIEKDIYFSWDPMFQAYVPRYSQGNLVYPEMWNAEEIVNKPMPAGFPPRNTMGEEDEPQYDPGLPAVPMPRGPIY